MILKLDIEEDVTAGGILIPDNAKTKLNTGIVRSVGPKVEVVMVGDHVLISNFGGQNINIDGEDLLVNDEADVLVILEEAETPEDRREHTLKLLANEPEGKRGV